MSDIFVTVEFVWRSVHEQRCTRTVLLENLLSVLRGDGRMPTLLMEGGSGEQRAVEVELTALMGLLVI